MASSRLAQLIQRHIDAGGFAGAAVIAAHRGEIVIEEYRGFAAPGRPAAATTLWPLASISKLYTAAMIMALLEQGEITLNTPASHLFPNFTGEGRELVRLRHLLTHTAGMIYESPEMTARLAAQTPREALVEEMFAMPLQFPPGTAFDYADYHYLLAGCMAEAATGKSFAELVETFVLQPMGVEESFIRPPQSLGARLAIIRAVMAEETDGAMYNSPYALALAHPAFGMVTTARDLVRFALHFAPGGPRIHSAATIRTMTSDQTGGVATKQSGPFGFQVNMPSPWGIGFALKGPTTPGLFADLASTQAYGHGGASGCQLVIDPAAEAVVAVLSNTHARSGREQWYRRLQSLLNCAFAALP